MKRSLAFSFGLFAAFVSLVGSAACGDDDDGGGPAAGTGGKAGAGGGPSGSSTGGTAGSPAGSGGSGGPGGQGGSAGSSAGAGGQGGSAGGVAVDPCLAGGAGAGGAGAGGAAGAGPGGLLDASFGGSGVVTVQGLESALGNFRSVAVDGAGRVYVGVSDQGRIARLCGDGRLDTSFGEQGFSPSRGGQFVSENLTVSPDGRAVVGGTNGNSGFIRFFRLNANGTADPSFGVVGTTSVSFQSGSDPRLEALATDGDRIVAAGWFSTPFVGSRDTAFVVRLLGDGTPDATFSPPDGFAEYQAPPGNTSGGAARFLALDVGPGGSVVAAGKGHLSEGSPGSEPDDFLLVRFGAVGALDSSFDGDGALYAEPGPLPNVFTSWEATAVARAADGKIVVGGTVTETSDVIGQVFGTDLVVARLLPDGKADPDFGEGGAFTLDQSTFHQLLDVVVLADGSIVALGATSDGAGPASFTLVRLRPDGTPDPALNGNGVLIANAPLPIPHGAALQPDGKLLVVGFSDLGDRFVPVVARFNPL